MRQRRILLTGGGAPGWYATYLALRDFGSITACDIQRTTPACSLVFHTYVVPPGSDELFLKELLKLIHKNNITTVVPLTDPELLPLAELSEVHDDIEIFVSPPETIRAITDKKSLYTNFPSISPKFSSNLAFATVGTWMKPSSGFGSRGVKKLVTHSEYCKRVLTDKPDVVGKLLPVSILNSLPLDDGFIFVEDLPGKEYSVDCLFSEDGMLIFYAVRERARTRNGICSHAKFIVDRTQEFKAVVSTVSSVFEFRYWVNFQLKRDATNHLKLLEINPRISGSLTSFSSAGFDFIKMMMKYIENEVYPFPQTPNGYPVSNFDSFRVSHFI